MLTMRTVLGLKKSNVEDVLVKKEADFKRIMSAARTPRFLKPKRTHFTQTMEFPDESDLVYHSSIELINEKMRERALGICKKCRKRNKIDPNGDSDICSECRVDLIRKGVRP